MKKLLWLIPVILIIIIIVVIVIIRSEDSSKQIEITKEINAGIPFKWEYVIEDESIVEFKKSYVIRDDNKGGLVGGKIVTNYVFVGKKEGITKITFKFVSITDEDYDDNEDVYTIRVDKDLNVSLIGKEY